ncbi:hypothetical protein [Sphingomonas sp. LY160]|uniref:hypothetical protein n=1 Tax=Sphingomonas sp. LY160 TaxID=3095342 RepID=UPI002ADEE465|nr:hypothetical protein [Sphingomonas sp. LY160]MEA1071299.1 hypothetical protein [Sphingomonas sp. LY160]
MRLPAIDARGWIGLGVFLLVVMLLWMMAAFPALRNDEFFKTIATLIIGTAFVNGVVSWAFAATKQGGELADRNATIIENQQAPPPPPGPQPVVIEQPADEPVPMKEVGGGDKLPDYAR